MPLACRRFKDVDLPCCDIPIRAQGAEKVIIGGCPWSCFGNLNHPHKWRLTKPCTIHVAPIIVGSPKVIVQGRPAGRVTSYVLMCTAVATGYPKLWVT